MWATEKKKTKVLCILTSLLSSCLWKAKVATFACSLQSCFKTVLESLRTKRIADDYISPQGDGFVTYNLTTVVTLFITAIEENRLRLLCWNLLQYKNSVAWYFGVKKKTWIKQFFILQISPMPLWKCSTTRDTYYAIEPGLRKDIYWLLF